MSSAGAELSSGIDWKPVDRLAFDPLNPRLPRDVDAASRAAVLNWMLRDAGLLELMQSIASQGYFPGEPVLIVRDDGSDHFVVVEGNRRLAAVVLLSHPELAQVRRKAVRDLSAAADSRPQALPTLMFESRDQIIEYLGYRHVTGIKEWEPLAKARYVEQLIQSGHAGDGDPLLAVAQKIGSRRDYLVRLMGALTLYERASDANFYDLRGVDAASVDFSLLTLALSYSSIRKFVGLREDGLAVTGPEQHAHELFSWIFQPLPDGATILGESRRMGDLASVVDKPAALAALRHGRSLSEAVVLTEAPLEAFRVHLRDARERVQAAVLQLAGVREIADSDIGAAEELLAVIRDLLAIIRARREEQSESGR